MNKLLVFLLIITSFAASAQGYDPEKISKKARDYFDKAMEKVQDGKLQDAAALFKKAADTDPHYMDAILSLAGAYQELKDYKAAVEQLEKARTIDTGYFHFFNLQYSINLAGLGRFNEALDAVNLYLATDKLNDRSRKSGELRRMTYQFALDYAKKHPATNYVFAPRNLGDSVNSTTSEYYPSTTIDGDLFVFTRRERGGENFYQCKILPEGKYSHYKLISGKLNDEPYKGAINISQDGEWLLFAADIPGGEGTFDIYISYATPTGWSDPENLGPAVNSEFWDSGPSLSPDKRALYFASTRPGGYGGSDIYVTYKLPNGRWTPAKNLGPSINTPGDEKAPFIHADNMTLYFTSDGLPGYGNSDLYVCRKQLNGDWSVPENLGYPINTIENEGSLFVAADGKTAYYASDRSDTRGELDLYSFELRSDVRPLKTLYVKGKVYDVKTGAGLPSNVELLDNATRKPVSNFQTDETGHYFVTLPIGRDYTFTVNRKGYLFYSDLFPLSLREPDSTYSKDIPLQPIELNASLVLKNVFFETNSAELKPVSVIEIDKLFQLLADNPTLKVQINGHTDNVGKPADNLKLSTARAKAVADYLVGKGIDAVRLGSKGFGETKPIADNSTEAGRALNRRTEFVVIGQ